MAKHNDFGKEGEAAALAYLLKQGHTLLQQNYRYKKAEVDLITKDGNAVVFTEVKARGNNSFGYPEEFVDKKKMKLLQLAADEYIYTNKLDADIRFDVISLTIQNNTFDIHHIRDAFLYEAGEELY